MNAPEKIPAWRPRAGTLAERVLDWFHVHPDEELTAMDIAQKFDVERTSVQPCLVGAEQAGAIVVAKDETGKRVYRLGNYRSPPPLPWIPLVKDIQSMPVLNIPFPDGRRRRAEAVGALRLKLMDLAVGQCIPAVPLLKPLLRDAMNQIDGRTFKAKTIEHGTFCWRVA